MSKELEALERMGCATLEEDLSVRDIYENEYDIVKNALQRLEATDNANPSEALECLETARKVLTKMFGKEVLDEKGINFDTIKQALLKSQENARSEEILQKYYQEGITLDSVRALREENAELRQKTQEPKHYLKWEDLDFKEKRQEIPVRMGETTYTLVLRKTDGGNKIAKLLSPKRNYMGEWGDIFYEEAKQFFNDLRLERVE